MENGCVFLKEGVVGVVGVVFFEIFWFFRGDSVGVDVFLFILEALMKLLSLRLILGPNSLNLFIELCVQVVKVSLLDVTLVSAYILQSALGAWLFFGAFRRFVRRLIDFIQGFGLLDFDALLTCFVVFFCWSIEVIWTLFIYVMPDIVG